MIIKRSVRFLQQNNNIKVFNRQIQLSSCKFVAMTVCAWCDSAVCDMCTLTKWRLDLTLCIKIMHLIFLEKQQFIQRSLTNYLEAISLANICRSTYKFDLASIVCGSMNMDSTLSG
jgi:hypothetical protein